MVKREPSVLQELLPKMSKLGRGVLSVAFLVVVLAVWLLGSIILIKIDSERTFKHFELDKRENIIKAHILSSCRALEKQHLQEETQETSIPESQLRDYSKLGGGNGTTVSTINSDNTFHKSQGILENAKREKLVRENLIYFPELEQMWCLAPKAASTSWSRAIVDRLNWENLRLFVDPKSNFSLQEILRQNYGSISKKIYTEALKSEKIKKILLVRHPFSRIISAYRDKLLDRKARADGMYFFQRYGVQMNRKFRKNRKLNKKKEPTFDEFVDYLINTKPMDYDEHWKPISLLCGLCHVQYDHIIFVEDLDETTDFHLKSLGFSDEYRFPSENIHSAMDVDFREPFRNISSLKKIKLLRKYKDDFRLFRYNFISHYTF